MTLALLWFQLAAAAGIILVTAHYMAGSADVIAEKTGLGRTFVGVVMLATATSLPELATGVSSIALLDEVDLAAGDAFGSNMFNLLIIGVLDVYWRKGPVLSDVSPTAALVGSLGALLIAISLAATIFHHLTDSFTIWHISPVSLVLFAAFLAAMFLIYMAGAKSDGETTGETSQSAQDAGSQPVPQVSSQAAEALLYEDRGLGRAFIIYALTASAVVGAAIWLAYSGDKIADEMGWEASFMGTQFLALSTSLPEIAASFAALRLGAPELAITNLLGSNLFNMGFVLFIDDIVFTGGALWQEIADVHTLTAVVAIAMTAIVIAGIQTTRLKAGRRPIITFEGASMLLLYILTSVMVFYLS